MNLKKNIYIFFAALAAHLKLTQYCKWTLLQLKKKPLWHFPGGPVVKSAFSARDAGLILGQGTKILHDAWYGKKIKIKEALGLDIESNSNSMPWTDMGSEVSLVATSRLSFQGCKMGL